MSAISTGADTGPAARRRAHIHRAVWRWHFYAGLFSLPFLVLLAVTGGLYLFKDEIDLARHADLLTVAGVESPRPLSDLVAAAVAVQPGTAAKVIMPATPERSLEVLIDDAAGTRQAVYVDPASGAVLGQIAQDEKLMQVVRSIHSLILFGDGPNRVIEIVGGWTVILVITGIYLWWPRGGAPAVALRGRPANRLFWRDLHAVTGLFGGGFVLFLALSGMPWSGVFGDYLDRGITAAGEGYPAYLWAAAPESTVPLGADGPVAWTLENSPVPSSAPGAGANIGIDRAAAIATAAGIAPGFTLVPPKEATGVYTATIFPDDLSHQRAIHIDQYSGKVLADVGFADYGAGAKTIEFGINVHMGQEFGLANQLLMLGACLSIIALAVSSLVMWWKRRPAGSLGVPPVPAPGTMAVAGMIILVLSLVFPLTAASLLVIATLDTLFHLPALRAAGRPTIGG